MGKGPELGWREMTQVIRNPYLRREVRFVFAEHGK